MFGLFEHFHGALPPAGHRRHVGPVPHGAGESEGEGEDGEELDGVGDDRVPAQLLLAQVLREEAGLEVRVGAVDDQQAQERLQGNAEDLEPVAELRRKIKIEIFC